jgi:hypothetical protein
MQVTFHSAPKAVRVRFLIRAIRVIRGLFSLAL